MNYDSCDPLNVITATDISYSIELAGGGAAPSWFNYNSATRTFSFSPTTEITADAVYSIVIKATADSIHFDEETFTLTVQPNNKAPVFDTTPAATLQCYVGNTCQENYAYSDENAGDILTFTFAEQEPNPTLPAYRLDTRTWLTNDATKVYIVASAANIGTHVLGLLVEDDNSVNDASGAKEAYFTISLTVLY